MSLTWGQSITANTIGIATSVLPFGTSIPAIGLTAAFTQDEFYDQVRYVHQITAIPIAATEMLSAYVIGAYTFGPIVPVIAAISVATNLFINNLIVPNLADQIHEYTHPNYEINLDSFYAINPHSEQNIKPIGIDHNITVESI